MTSAKVRDNNLEKALRILKKKVDREGIMRSAKAHRFYLKPSIKKRAKSKAALKHRT